MTKRARYPTFRAWLDTQWDPNYDGDPDIPSLLNTNNLIANRPIKTINSYSLEGVGNVSLAKADVGLSNADNTSDVNKPISTATQAALNSKQSTLVSGTNLKTVNSNSLIGSGNVDVGTVTSLQPVIFTNTYDTDNTFYSSISNPTTTPQISINIPHASDVIRGVVSLGTQSFAGMKTFLNRVTFINGIDLGSWILPTANGGTNNGVLNGDRIILSNSASDKLIEAPTIPDGHWLIGNTGGKPTVGTATVGYGLSKTTTPGSIGLSLNQICYNTAFTSPVTTTSLTDVVLISLNVDAGRYLVFFSSTMSNSNSDKQGTVTIYVNGTPYPQSSRQELSNADRKIHIGTMSYIGTGGVTGTSVIDVRWNVLANTGTCWNAQLIAQKLADFP